MPKFKLELDQETYEKLLAIAFSERRPTEWQAEVLLTQAIREASDVLTEGVDRQAAHGCTAVMDRSALMTRQGESRRTQR